MRNNIYLVRHAEAESNVDPLSTRQNVLTDNGVLQAQKLAEYSKTLHIKDVYTSDSIRTRETAKTICASINREPITLEFLKERKVQYINSSEYIHEETFEDLERRVKETKEYLENLPEGHVVVVAHAIFLKAFIALVLSKETFCEKVCESISSSLTIDNASISKLVYNTEKASWRIDFLNVTD